jgi:hypothetical protein
MTWLRRLWFHVLKTGERMLAKRSDSTGITACLRVGPLWLLSPQYAPNSPILQASVNDQIPAAAAKVISRTITEAPASFVQSRVFRSRNQALFKFDPLSPSLVIRDRHRPRQRHGQFIFQYSFIQRVLHTAFPSGLSENFLSLAEFADATVSGDKIKDGRRNDKFSHIMGRLEIGIFADRALIRFTRFLQVFRIGIGVGVKGSHDFKTLKSTSAMGRDARAPRVANAGEC